MSAQGIDGTPEKRSSADASKSSPYDVGIDERPPGTQLAILGLQHIFGMTGMFVLPGILGHAFALSPAQIAYLYAVTFIGSGLATIFHSVFLVRLPIVQGTYAGCFTALLAIGHAPGGGGLAAAYGSLLVASLIWCIAAAPIRGRSLIGMASAYFSSPLISGMIVLLIMIQIASLALPNWIGTKFTPGHPLVTTSCGAVTVAILVWLTINGKGLWRRAAILLALMAGTALFAVFVPVSFGSVLSAPFFVAPRLFPFGFQVRADFVAIFLLTLLPAALGSLAMYDIVADWGGQTLSLDRKSQGVLVIAIVSVLAGLIGGFATIAYPDNVGMLRTTRVGSRYATLSAGLLLVALGSFAKFDMLLVIVPLPILSAAATLLFGVIMMHGIEIMAKVKWDERALTIGGLSLLVGLGGLFIDPAVFGEFPLFLQISLKQPLVSGGVVLLVLFMLIGVRTQEAAAASVS